MTMGLLIAYIVAGAIATIVVLAYFAWSFFCGDADSSKVSREPQAPDANEELLRKLLSEMKEQRKSLENLVAKVNKSEELLSQLSSSHTNDGVSLTALYKSVLRENERKIQRLNFLMSEIRASERGASELRTTERVIKNAIKKKISFDSLALYVPYEVCFEDKTGLVAEREKHEEHREGHSNQG